MDIFCEIRRQTEEGWGKKQCKQYGIIKPVSVGVKFFHLLSLTGLL